MSRDVILGCAVEMRRNIAGVPFPSKLADAGRLDAEFTDGFDELCGEYSLRVGAPGYPDADMMLEDILSRRNKQTLPDRVYTGENGTMLLINAGDHFVLRARRLDDDIQAAYDCCAAMESRLALSVNFAFDPVLGYLTSSTEDTGNAMHAQVILHLPALTELEKIEDTRKQLTEEGFELIKLVEHEDSACAFYCLKSIKTLGKSCRQVLSGTAEEMKAIETAERTARESLVFEDPDDFADKVLRSTGVLENARLLEYEEFIELYSDVRMGIIGDVLSGDSDDMDSFALDMAPRGMLRRHGELDDRDDLLYRASDVRLKLSQAITRRKME